MSLYSYIFGGKVAKKAYRVYQGKTRFDSVNPYIQLVADVIWCFENGVDSRFTMVRGNEEVIESAIQKIDYNLSAIGVSIDTVDFTFGDGMAEGEIKLHSVAKQYIGY